MPSCCRRRHQGDVAAALAALGRAPNIGTSSVRRIAQLSPAFPGAALHADPRQRRHAAAQARCGRIRRAGARRRRPAPARLRRPHHGDDSAAPVRAGAGPGHRRGRNPRRRRAVPARAAAGARRRGVRGARCRTARRVGARRRLPAAARRARHDQRHARWSCRRSSARPTAAASSAPRRADPPPIRWRSAIASPNSSSRDGAVEILDEVRQR